MEKKIHGIDVSKDSLEVSYGSKGKQISIKNNIKAIEKYTDTLVKEGVDLVVLESTGGYEMLIVNRLWELGVPVSVINPRQIYAFTRSMGCEAKTDKIDARVIALFGEKMSPKITQAPSEEVRELQILHTRRSQLNQILVAEKNHLQAPILNKAISSMIKKSISCIKKQMAKIDKRIKEIISNSIELSEKRKVISNITGAGPVLTSRLISDVPELGTINRRKISALIGVAPFNRDSGTYAGKRKISGGRAEVRSVLYMATLSAIRHNVKIKTFYLGLLAKGKIKMVAFVAAMRKFIILINSTLKQYFTNKKNITTALANI